jgi:hypothetical protein
MRDRSGGNERLSPHDNRPIIGFHVQAELSGVLAGYR